MKGKGTLGFVLGAALVAAVIAGIHLGLSWPDAAIGFFTLAAVSVLTLAIAFEEHGAGLVFVDVVIAGFYAYFAIMYMATGGTLLGVGLGALYGVVVYMGWLIEPSKADGDAGLRSGTGGAGRDLPGLQSGTGGAGRELPGRQSGTGDHGEPGEPGQA